MEFKNCKKFLNHDGRMIKSKNTCYWRCIDQKIELNIKDDYKKEKNWNIYKVNVIM